MPGNYSDTSNIAAGEEINAADVKTPIDALDDALYDLDDALYDLAIGSGARVYNSVDITITHATPTALTFNNERYDTDSFHSQLINPGRLTVPAAGRYQVGCNVAFDNNATGARVVYLLVNGRAVIAQVIRDAVSSAHTVINLNTVWSFAAADYIEVICNQTSGGDLAVKAGTASPEFWIEQLAIS